MIICPKCGKELADGVKFCKYCGTEIVVQSGIQQSQQKTPAKSSKKVMIAVIAVLLVALIVLGVIFIPKFLDKKDDVEKTTEKSSQSTSADVSTTQPDKTTDTSDSADKKDIYKSPNGKYYVPVKISHYYGDMIDDLDVLSWDSGSVKTVSYYGEFEYKYDNNGKIISESVLSSQSGSEYFEHTYSDGLITQTKRFGDISTVSDYEYDSSNRLVKKVRTESGTSEAGIYTEKFVYDNQNRIVQYINDNDSAMLTYKSDNEFAFSGFGMDGTVTYNNYGKIEKATMIMGSQTDVIYTYDANQNLVSVVFASAESEEDYSIEIEWAEATKEQAVFGEYIVNDALSSGGNYFLYYHYPDNDHILYNFIY